MHAVWDNMLRNTQEPWRKRPKYKTKQSTH